MTDTDAVTQLADELAARLEPFDVIAKELGYGRPFMGALDRLDPGELVERLATDARRPDVARAVLEALWPLGVPSDWWQTPLARIIAEALAEATDEAEMVTVAEAARMLGIGHTRVIQLADDERLVRTDAGVSLASVYARVARPGQSGRPGWRTDTQTRSVPPAATEGTLPKGL